MSGRWRLGLGLMMVVALGLAARGIMERRQTGQALAQDAALGNRMQVEVTHGKPLAGLPELVVPGQLQAWVDTPIYAHASGYVKRWMVDIGGRVSQGQIIAELSTPDLDAEQAQAQAQQRSAEAAAELARVTAERYAKLLPSRTVSPQDADNKRLDASMQQQTLVAAQANTARLKAMDQYRFITAPRAGLITVRNVDVGTLVDGGSANGSAKELFHLADIHRMRAFIPVPEDEVGELPQGGKVTLTLRAYPGQTWSAQLVHRAHAVDPRQHTELVELDLDNTQEKLLPGGYVEAHFSRSAASQALMLPSNTLLFRAAGTLVAVLDGEHRVHLAPVIVGRDLGDRLEILSGVTQTDMVVVSPPDSLSDGMQLVPRESQGNTP